MALMDLLTVGRSLSEVRYRPHRFKLLNGALPKFGKSAAPEINTNVKFAVSEDAGSGVRQKRDGSDKMQTETIADGQKQAASAPIHAYPTGRWTLNPFKTASPPSPNRTIQGELSLDNVKPVRNDLSDSDLELVAVKKAPEATPPAVQIESVRVPVVKVKSLLERASQLFRRVK